MDLRVGEIVYLNHYSGRKPIVSTVIEANAEFVKVHLNDMVKEARINLNEPIVLNFEDGKNLITCEGYVLELSKQEKFVKLRIDNEQIFDNNRICERFPVSLYGTIRVSSGKKNIAVVKNVSLGGMAITSKFDLKIGQKFDYEVYIDERVIKVVGEVVWKKKVGLMNEYGIMNSFEDFVVKNTMKLFLDILKTEHKNMIMNEIGSATLSNVYDA